MIDNSTLNYFSTKTLLIAEDHQPTRELLKSTLENFFKDIQLATDGKECLEQIRLKKTDLLITDIKMPFKNGIECIENIRKIDFDLPIIIISAFSDDKYLLKAANLDIQGYLLKPLDLKELENSLMKIAGLSKNNSRFEITPEMIYDASNSIIFYKGDEIPLTKKENGFLNLLLKNKGILVPYQQIEYELWEKNDEMMSINSLRTLIKKLRSKLPINIIKNVSKTGYKFYIK